MTKETNILVLSPKIYIGHEVIKSDMESFQMSSMKLPNEFFTLKLL